MRNFVFPLVLFLGVSVFGLSACNKDNERIPYVPVNINININNPAFIDLNAVGNWIYITCGSKGMIVYRASIDEFLSYDRHSPYLPDNDCTCEVDSSGVIVFDPCSNSRFTITDGNVIDGEAVFPLLQYENTFDGTNLQIYN